MITNVHITKWSATDKKKDGSELKDKKGNKFWRVSIQATEFEGWASGLVFTQPEDWSGQEIPLELFDEDYEGKTYKKFKIPNKSSQEMAELDAKLEKILNNTTAIRLRMEVLADFVTGKEKKTKVDYTASTGPTAFDEPAFEEEPPF